MCLSGCLCEHIPCMCVGACGCPGKPEEGNRSGGLEDPVLSPLYLTGGGGWNTEVSSHGILQEDKVSPQISVRTVSKI